MSPIKTYEALAFVIAFVLVLAAAGIKGYRMGEASSDAKHMAAEVAGRDAQDKTLRAAAQALQAMAPAQAKIIERVTHATVEKTVYRDCVNDPGVVRDINAALTNSEPAGDQPMSAASAPR
jgi:outer membrane murein-binding lipoprotein Lpp